MSGRTMSDEQAAAVVNSVGARFGEAHAGAVSVEAAKAVRRLTM